MAVRLQQFDIARGIGIILVVLGHNWLVLHERGLIFRVIFSFHIPLFLFMSGVFFKAEEDLLPLIRKRSDALLKPYLATLMLLALDDVWRQAKVPASDYFGGVLYGVGSTIPWMPMWFLPHLWLLTLVAWLVVRGLPLQRWTLGKQLLVLGTTLFAGASLIEVRELTPALLGDSWIANGWPLSLDLLLVTGPFYLAGYLWRDRLQEWTRPRWHLLALAALAFAVPHAFGATLDLNLRRYDHAVLSTLGAVSGVYMISAISRACSAVPALAGPLAYVGSASLFVLIFHHTLQDKAFRVISARLPEPAAAVLAFVVGVAASLVGFELAKRIKPLAWLFLPVAAKRPQVEVPAPGTSAGAVGEQVERVG